MNRRSCHALGLCQSLAPACPECDHPQTTKKQTNTMKPTLHPHNERLLAFIGQHQPISSRALFTSYADAGENASAFAKRLSNLSAQGWLLSSGHANRATWQVDPARASFFPARAAPVEPPQPPGIAAPSRINIMQGTYHPAPAPVMRPGSEDHTRLPSLRQGQRVAFVAGYIPL